MKTKVIGITRVRNEGLILEDTLSHFLDLTHEIILLDDDSTDNTVKIAKSFGDRVTVINGGPWSSDRPAEETAHRKRLTNLAMVKGADWVLCFDADERIRLRDEFFHYNVPGVDAWRFRLFDGYMVEGSEPYTGGDLMRLERMWGPEYRDIIFMFRPQKARWEGRDRREPKIVGTVKQATSMMVQHYGKCLSVEHWEETCDYYANHWPEPYKSKWAARRGKAIHEVSDFGAPLYTCDEVFNHGVKL